MYRPMCQTISSSGAIMKYSPAKSPSLDGMKVAANHITAAVGTIRSKRSRKICIRILTVSMNHNGYASRQLSAARFSFAKRPTGRAGAPSHISSQPTLLRMGVKGVIQAPRPTVTSLATDARIPILQPLSR